MYRIDIGIDLGTSKVCVYMRDKGIVINQPSVIAFEKKEKKIIAVGKKAKKMLGKTTDDIIVARPIKNGVISEYMLAERMIKAFVKNALRKRRILGRPNICVAVPQGITEVERRAVEDAIVKTGAKEVFLLESPIAAALGSGVDIMETKGHMVVDIGGGTTDIAVISAGDISYGVSLKVGGDDFTEALARYVRRKYSVEMGEQSAEDAKIEIASVSYRSVDSSYEIKGKNMVNGLPVRLDLGANETVEALSEVTGQILDGIVSVLEKAEPEIVADVGKEGILLSGGGSLIYGMDRLIADKAGIRTVLSDEPENVVAAGAGMAGEYIMVQDEDSKR
ncbi:rod shape-determining protein MreB [Lachnospiraceae bacterium NE2001]|nr:rod shape-determining protein MreB [Lachnospiraceae bacterium NE2001]